MSGESSPVFVPPPSFVVGWVRNRTWVYFIPMRFLKRAHYFAIKLNYKPLVFCGEIEKYAGILFCSCNVLQPTYLLYYLGAL